MRRRKELSGFWDFIKRLAPPPPVSRAMVPYVSKEQQQLPVVRPSTLPAAPQKESKQLSLFDFAEPGRKLPIIERLERAFGFLPPAPPPAQELIPHVPEEKPEQTWEEMFSPSSEPPSSNVPDMFEFMKPEAQAEARQYIHPEEWPFGEPPLWQNTKWQMPTTMEVMEYVRQRWDLPGMYEFVLNRVEDPFWKKAVADTPHYGSPATMDVDLVSTAPDSFFDMARFLRIPDPIIELYGRQGPDGIERFTVEVLQPMLEKVGKALDVFRPTPELHGWFVLEPDEDQNFWVRYKEAKQYPQLGR